MQRHVAHFEIFCGSERGMLATPHSNIECSRKSGRYTTILPKTSRSRTSPRENSDDYCHCLRYHFFQELASESALGTALPLRV